MTALSKKYVTFPDTFKTILNYAATFEPEDSAKFPNDGLQGIMEDLQASNFL